MSSLPHEIEFNTKLGRLFGLIDQRPIIKLIARIILELAIILIVLSLIFLIIFGLYYIFIVKKRQRLNNEPELDGVDRGVLLNISTKKYSFIVKTNDEHDLVQDSIISTKEFKNLIE